MRRKEAEKLLAALIFGDLDEASKTDLTAYLRTDDELRERLADMRMAVKVAADTLQHGPEPVLGKRRLRRLARLAGRRNRTSVVFTARRLAIAAGIVAAVLLPSYIIFNGPNLSKVRSLAMELTGDSKALYSFEDQSDSYAETAEESPEGREKFAKADRRQAQYTVELLDKAAVYSDELRLANATYSSNGQLAADGHADEITNTMKIGGGVYPLSDKKVAFESTHYYDYNAPMDVVADGSGLRGVRGSYSYDVARSGGKNESKPDATGGAEMHERTTLTGEEVNRQMGYSPKARDIGRRDSVMAGESPAPAGKTVSAPGEVVPPPTRPGLTRLPVIASGPSQDSEPKSHTAVSTWETPTISTESETAKSMRKPPAGVRHDAISTEKGADYRGKQSGAAKDFKPVYEASIATDDAFLIADHGTVQKSQLGPAPKLEPITPPEKGLKGKELPFDKEQRDRITDGLEDIVVVDADKTAEAWVPNEIKADATEKESLRLIRPVMPVEEDEADLPAAARFKTVPVNPWVMTERDSLSTFALDVDTASFTLCRRYINGGFLPPAGAVRMEEFVNYFNYHYPQRTNPTFAVYAEAARSPFAEKGKNMTLLKIGVKARTIGRDQRKAAHLVFVVDSSASMDRPDRLGLVQQALGLLIDRLSPVDRVTLVTCANESRLHLEAVSAGDRERIRRAVNAIQPSGPTNLLVGLKLGYAVARRAFAPKQINHVVLCSDGVANVGQTDPEAVLADVAADRKQGITLTCVGVGYGSYNDAFMEALANSGDGSYVFLDSVRQAQRVFVEQLSATLNTVAKDARIQVDFNPDRVRRYRLIGYENRDIEDERFRDDTVDAGEVGSGQCSTALYELELTGQAAADRGADLGTVFVRYRNADTNRMEEISSRLKSTIVQELTVKSSPRFFLAATAARFAEILRQSEHAQGSGIAEVLGVAEQVSLALPLDGDVHRFLELIRKSEHLPRSP